MVSPRLQSRVLEISAVFFTHASRVTGMFPARHLSLLAALNAADTNYLTVHDATVEPLRQPGPQNAHTVSAVSIRREAVVLASAGESQIGRERTASPMGQAHLEVSPFQVHAGLPMGPGADLPRQVLGARDTFLLLTDAQVTFEPNPAVAFRVPYLLVNRLLVGLVEAVPVAATVPATPALREQAHLVERAVDMLATTPVFGNIDRSQLRAALDRLCNQGLIVHKNVGAGVAVFHQGDLGDTLYVVDAGRLEVLFADSRGHQHRLAELGPAEIMGEMAVLGDSRRSATIRAVTDAALLAIHEDAVKALMQRFPSAAGGLLAMMTQRQAALQQLNRMG